MDRTYTVGLKKELHCFDEHPGVYIMQIDMVLDGELAAGVKMESVKGGGRNEDKFSSETRSTHWL